MLDIHVILRLVRASVSRPAVHLETPDNGHKLMPKLIVKHQDTEAVSWVQRHSKVLSYAGFAAIMLVAVAFFLFSALNSKPDGQVVVAALPKLDSASNADAKAKCLLQWQQLAEMGSVYENLSQEPEAYARAQALLRQAETALDHLYAMEDTMTALGLSGTELTRLQAEQAYLQDEWLARLHFRELRVGRLVEGAGGVVPAVAPAQPEQPAAAAPAVKLEPTAKVADVEVPEAKQANRAGIAAPPPGVKLPEGFCTLSGEGACKPEASN